ncbi:hypothetical protein Fmac_029376 [Flemingia macrophylla]|uniref:CCHC-type domain-containing protein n=1 Tax=Flemingia macrophylla TaxID=520843 RepID=A0ABD1LA72_9FABA
MVDLMDHEKNCEANTPLPMPPVSLSPSESSLSQLYPNTPEILSSYDPKVLRRMENDTCYTCQQKGHWSWHCPLKSSNARPFTQSIWCRCGHGRCDVKTAKSAKNSGRMYYTCPIKGGAKCNDFVKWCDDPVDESDLQPPAFKYPECVCAAGVCRRVKKMQNLGAVKYCFICPIMQGHGSCGYLVWEDELLVNESIVSMRQSCKRTLDGFGEGNQDDQTDNDLGEGGDLLVKHPKKMRIVDTSGYPTLMDVSDDELVEREDTALKETPPLSCLSAASTISGRHNGFKMHSFAGAVISSGFSSMDWLGRLIFSIPPQSLKSPSPQQIFCYVPKQASVPHAPCGENNRLDAINLSQETQLSSVCHTEFSTDDFGPNKSSSSERKPMSRAQRQRQVAYVAKQQLIIDLVALELEPHQHDSMKEAAHDTFALLDNIGASDEQFRELISDFISLTSSIAQMNISIEEQSKCLEEEKAKRAHIHNLYVKTEAMFQASAQRRESLCREISHFEAILFEKQNQLKSYELETLNMETELGDLRRTMLEADAASKARAEQAKVARKLMEERQAKHIAAKTILEKALLELQY